MTSTSAIESRISEVLALFGQGELENAVRHGIAATVSLLSAAYGPDSVQLRTFVDATTEGKMTMGRGGFFPTSRTVIEGTLRNLQADMKGGLTRNLRGQVTGEIVSDFVRLAREAFSDGSEGAKNVAAVLAAAAFEDTLRRLADLKGIPHHEKLADVITALKEKDILAGAQVSIAISYLKFRNEALHARWDSVERESVASILGFVEQLLLKHFS